MKTNAGLLSHKTPPKNNAPVSHRGHRHQQKYTYIEFTDSVTLNTPLNIDINPFNYFLI